MTFEIFEGKDIKVDFQKDKISFSGIQAEGEQKYEVELELFDEVVPEVTEVACAALHSYYRNAVNIIRLVPLSVPWKRPMKDHFGLA